MLRYISLGDGSSIATYNLLIGIGIAISMLYLQSQAAFRSLSEGTKFRIHLSLIVSILIGFAAAFAFDAWSQGIPLRFENLNRIGLTLFSGLVTGMFLLAGFLRAFSIPVLRTLNLIAPACCIAHIFGRVGCFLAGCCFGKPTATMFGVKFPEGSIPYLFHGASPLHPTQLYESFFVLTVFLYIHFRKPGNALAIYLGSYSVFRFFIEYLRDDNRGTILGQTFFSPSQLISIGVLAIAFVIIFFKGNGRITTTSSAI